MFDRNLFEYDPHTHIGTYQGVVVPSVTQLVDILYPYSSDIPKERLENAAKKGTELHELIEKLNCLFDNSFDFDTNLNEAIDTATRTQKQELIDYVSLLKVYGLRPHDYEELIFLCDVNGDLICYGHYDNTWIATKDIACFQEGRLYLNDYKTTSLFDKRKVTLQLSIYASAYEQCSGNQISGITGTWFNEGIKLIPLKRQDKEYTIALCKQLKEIYDDAK